MCWNPDQKRMWPRSILGRGEQEGEAQTLIYTNHVEVARSDLNLKSTPKRTMEGEVKS